MREVEQTRDQTRTCVEVALTAACADSDGRLTRVGRSEDWVLTVRQIPYTYLQIDDFIQEV